MKLLKSLLIVTALVMGMVGSAFAAAYENTFTISTTAISGQSGYIDFQYNPGPDTLAAGSAVTVDFLSDGVLGSHIERTGNVYGTLPQMVFEISSPTSQLNEYFQSFTFGDTISFRVIIDSYNGSTFSFAMYNADETAALLTTNESGNILEITTNTDQTTTVNYTPTPIPAAVWLLGSGLMGLIGVRRRIQA